jgi:hypothetical protein
MKKPKSQTKTTSGTFNSNWICIILHTTACPYCGRTIIAKTEYRKPKKKGKKK